MNHLIRPLTATLLSLSLLAACSPSGPQAPVATGQPATVAAAPVIPATVYRGARVIPGDGSDAIENATFIVQEGRFTAVGPTDSVQVPAAATVIDLTGTTVIPTLIDTHVHLSTERDALLADLRRRVSYGVSAAFGMGMDGSEIPLRVRDEQAPGLALYRSAGRGITRPEEGRTTVPHWVNTAEEARAAVQAEAARNVDIIKIWVDDRNGQFEKLTPELYGAVIDEAHANNLRVTAHIFSMEDATGLLNAGADAFAHGVRDRDVDDAFMALMAAHPDVVVVPNLPSRGVATDLEWLRGTIPDEQLQQMSAAPTGQQQVIDAFGIQARNLARMSAAGVKIAMGTDGNTPWGPHIEMEDMVASGMSPAAVITAATSTSAAYMSLDDRGAISTGKVADFLVLEANPLEDITNTRRIRSVYLAGAAATGN
jgi:imidazolonepropionase-like amidohydrolase